MNVNQIRDRIVELSHQSTADGEVQAKALGWLNAAYHELMDDILPFAPAALQVQEVVAVGADGQGATALPPYRILAVVDTATGSPLRVATPAEALAADPAGTLGGTYRLYVPTAAGVRLVPAGEGAVTVLYVPQVADLAENGAEDAVLLPRAHHMALVWGGLVWSSLFERGFGTQGELAMFQAQWQRAKEGVKLALAGNATLRVIGY